ncbi:MAG: hypothetical protein IIX60_03355, partial [Clostridia bacterium]|nr:hypothetical protein [Clostridia bacterium]
FFRLMADKDIFNTLVFLYKRESGNSFTEKLLIKELNLTRERATQVISELQQVGLLYKTVAEVDDGVLVFYQFAARPAFVSMLIFAREMIDIPNNFYVNNQSRRKPYLK